MKTGKILHRFTANDGREVILRTPKWEDLNDLIEFINSLVEEGAEIFINQKVTRKQEAEWLDKRFAETENDQEFLFLAEVARKIVANSSITKKQDIQSMLVI